MLGLAGGLALAPTRLAGPPLRVLILFAVLLTLARQLRAPRLPWLASVAGCALLAGLSIGSARLAAIDANALEPDPGTPVAVRGPIVSAPRTSEGTTSFVISVGEGRIGVAATGLADVPEQGRIVALEGTVRETAAWERAALLRSGVARVVVTDEVRATHLRREGLAGALDGIRQRAESVLERGNSKPAAALLRGFVLGQDDLISEPVREEFRRSGLAHVLAVSGQNVMLLALLAAPIFALIGVSLRSRIVAIVIVIAIYVPVAGAGASIQRAGVMGAAGLVAALASRPRARWYALCLAAVVTLAIDPRATGDVGWQLSFAAVAGLLVLAAPLTRIFRGPSPASPARRLISEGLAMTLAATLATAPLAAHHFEVVSLTAIPANILALPAIAPAMWLGMLSGALGQIAGAPVEPLSAVGGLCAGYIGWVAHTLGDRWAQVELAAPGPVVTLLLTLALLCGARLACLAWERRRGLTTRPKRWRIAALAALLLAVGLAGAWARGDIGTGSAPRAVPQLTLRVFDVGQGDAILLEPRNAQPILVDTGPPGSGVADRLGELDIESLGALALTHDDLDHSGALGEVLASVHVGRLLIAHGSPPSACESIRCPRTTALSQGQSVTSGRLRMAVLWPAGEDEPEPGEEPNGRSLVIHASLREFDALLTGDAESESAAYPAPPVEVLKIAHHGSADAGLPGLLAETSPDVALISVGGANPYGHPAPETLAALEGAAVPARRTDEDGEIVIEVRGDGWIVG